MSDAHDEEINSISPSQSSEIDEDEIENGYESNGTDSLNLDEEEEEDDGGSFSIPCLSVGGSLVLHIDQTGGVPSSVPNTLTLGGTQSNTSTTTSLSDTASENTSTHAVMGDTPSTAETNGLPPSEEDAADNSSQVSTVDSEAERVRRIHNTIFSSLENDLAELVRIREETIQFLESGVSSGSFTGGTGEGGATTESSTLDQDQNNPFTLRERLTYYTRPLTSGEPAPQFMNAATTTNNGEEGGGISNTATLQARSYTPIAKFDNAAPAKPAKPYLEVGLTSCDEKAAAARKVLDKLQYGDAEDESACFVRRFWRETSTVVDNSPSAPLSLDVAAIAQRTASLQASLEEAFDGLRLRLQQVRTPDSSAGLDNQEEGQRENSGGGGGDADLSGRENNNLENNGDISSDYQNWERETSIMNDPLNYDIWNELEEGSEAGPTITARINLAERRAIANRMIRQPTRQSSSVAVGNDNNGGGNLLEGAEMDDDSTDDEEMMSYFRFRCNNDPNSNNSHGHRPNNVPGNMSQESREFFRDVGISEEMGQDLLNMFTFSEEDVQVPSNLQLDENSEMSSYEIPEPLFSQTNNYYPSASGPNSNRGFSEYQEQRNNSGPMMTSNHPAITEPSNENEEGSSLPPQLPLFDASPCIHIAPNREDECSTRVYLNENYLDFPFNHNQDDQNQDE